MHFSSEHKVEPRTKRTRYLSLHEAVYDDSQPEFDPRAYVIDGNGTYDIPMSATPLLEGDHKKLQSPAALYPGGLPKPHRKHPFADGFEAPRWPNILFHVALCLVAYPLLLIVTLIAREKPLFWTRFIVGLGCGIIGVSLALSLLKLAQAHLEATTWATIIHQSRVDESPGVKLRNLAAISQDPTSALSGLRLLWDRWMYHGTSQNAREHYDRRPWSIFVVLFLLLVAIAGSLTFVLGRLVDINTTVLHQLESYEEVAVMGGNSDDDISRAAALRSAFNVLTWTLAPFSTNGGLPPVVSFEWKNDTVFFSEVVLPQLVPGGSGFGTFASDSMNTSANLGVTNEIKTSSASEEVTTGAILRHLKTQQSSPS
ncbi:hypothetical protein H0H81_007842 [Sphagnurus paluster]|uniref:Uncharacterized protein n=1 Tax=Sphagnurus paluster TaxID=117069 RepID=A0A9P7GKG9_9AGAR|nr:hypothetical protein H0H81_007842 [Sphagnurus paluster]